MPVVPMVAALSASHLAALFLPADLKRLYVACDADEAGERARERLTERARAAGVEVLPLRPCRGDFNEDLTIDGPAALWRRCATRSPRRTSRITPHPDG